MLKINSNDTEDCHCMGKSNKGTIIFFVNRKNCKAVWIKKFNLNRKLKKELTRAGKT